MFIKCTYIFDRLTWGYLHARQRLVGRSFPTSMHHKSFESAMQLFDFQDFSHDRITLCRIHYLHPISSISCYQCMNGGPVDAPGDVSGISSVEVWISNVGRISSDGPERF